jgi:predicted RNA-binding Zn-ribbon protein involved in translation (DUF1610 family)
MAEKAEKAQEAEKMKEGDKSHLQTNDGSDAHMRCTSCGVKIEAEDKWVKFSCPKCNKQRIVRCDKCKRLMNAYECRKCGFMGP